MTRKKRNKKSRRRVPIPKASSKFVTVLSLVLLGAKKTAVRDGVDDDVPRDDERGGAGATTTRRISLDVFFSPFESEFAETMN